MEQGLVGGCLCGKLRYKAVRLLDELPLHLGTWLLEFSTADLCCLLAGYTNARHYHRSGQAIEHVSDCMILHVL